MTTPGNRWSDDAFLDTLRSQVDPLADEAVAALERDGGIEAVNRIFRTLRAGDFQIPQDAPEPLRAFLAATEAPLPGTDPNQLARGGAVFYRHCLSAATVLLLSSLPNGYSAPCLSRILTISGDLQRHPYERLTGVLQLLVDISQAHAFRPEGVATVSAQKMRLLHAGIRRIVPRFRPDYVERYGLPVNHEDMLATIMGFSYLVIDGLRTLGARLKPQEEEDFYLLWRTFARRMGIHPDGQPDDGSWVPGTVAAAKTFYDAYARRHYVDARENPEGAQLSRLNLEMVDSFIPGWARPLGLGALPRLVMTELLGRDGMARAGIPPLVGHRPLGRVFSLLLRFCQTVSDDAPRHLGERLGHLVFQGMIDRDRGGAVTFLVPDSLSAMRQLA